MTKLRIMMFKLASSNVPGRSSLDPPFRIYFHLQMLKRRQDSDPRELGFASPFARPRIATKNPFEEMMAARVRDPPPMLGPGWHLSPPPPFTSFTPPTPTHPHPFPL